MGSQCTKSILGMRYSSSRGQHGAKMTISGKSADEYLEVAGEPELGACVEVMRDGVPLRMLIGSYWMST